MIWFDMIASYMGDFKVNISYMENMGMVDFKNPYCWDVFWSTENSTIWPAEIERVYPETEMPWSYGTWGVQDS